MKVSGGEKFEAALREVADKFSKPGTLRVGFLEGATYPGDGQSVASVAAFNEYGRTVTVTRDHPLGSETGGSYYQLPRPFFRNMVAKRKAGWPRVVELLLKANKYDTTRTMNQFGEEVRGELQQSIKDTNSPPLAPSTIARKGFSKPLIDTGHMQNSVDFDIKT